MAVDMVMVPVEQYCRPFLVLNGKTRMGWLEASKNMRQSIVALPLLPDCVHVPISSDDHITWASARIVSMALGFRRNGW